MVGLDEGDSEEINVGIAVGAYVGEYMGVSDGRYAGADEGT